MPRVEISLNVQSCSVLALETDLGHVPWLPKVGGGPSSARSGSVQIGHSIAITTTRALPYALLQCNNGFSGSKIVYRS